MKQNWIHEKILEEDRLSKIEEFYIWMKGKNLIFHLYDIVENIFWKLPTAFKAGQKILKGGKQVERR